jgi:hypothetical protein
MTWVTLTERTTTMTQQGLTLEEWNAFKPIHQCNDVIWRHIEPELLLLHNLHADVINAADMATATVAAREFCKAWNKLAKDMNRFWATVCGEKDSDFIMALTNSHPSTAAA